MAIDAAFMRAGNLHRLCEITFAGGHTAKVEPYAIFTSPKKRRHYLWFLISSSDPEETPGWKMPEAATVASAGLTEESFTVRRDYDPFDKENLLMVHFSIPTHDGRQRWLDAQPGRDKTTLVNRPL